MIAAHRYDEAICLEDDGHYHPQYNPELIAALVAELKPTLAVHALSQDEIDQAFASASSDVRARAREANKRLFVVRTRIERQDGSTHKSSVSAYLKGGSNHDLPDLVDQEKLADFFHEKLPASHQEGPGVLDSVSAWGTDVAAHPIANALTFGVWSALTGPSAPSKMVPPTDADYQRMAPITEGMSRAFRWWPCGDKAEGPCDSSHIYLRPKNESTLPIVLQFAISAESFNEGGVFTSARTCHVYDSVEVELPTGGTIEERFAVTFGDKTRSYDEIARMKRRAPAR